MAAAHKHFSVTQISFMSIRNNHMWPAYHLVAFFKSSEQGFHIVAVNTLDMPMENLKAIMQLLDIHYFFVGTFALLLVEVDNIDEVV